MDKSTLIAAALAGLVTTSLGCSSQTVGADDQVTGECHGVNSCKGTGECGGPGWSCAGKNTCKGHGWVTLTKNECTQKGGTFKAN